MLPLALLAIPFVKLPNIKVKPKGLMPKDGYILQNCDACGGYYVKSGNSNFSQVLYESISITNAKGEHRSICFKCIFKAIDNMNL